MRESHGDLESARVQGQLRAEGHVARTSPPVRRRHGAVGVVEVDPEVRRVPIAGAGPGERANQGDVDVALACQEDGRVEGEHLRFVALTPRNHVRSGHQVEAQVGQLRVEGAGDQQRAPVGVDDEVEAQVVLVVGAEDRKGGDAWPQPAQAVVCLSRVVDRRSARRSDQEAELVEGRLAEARKEDLTQVAPGEGEPDFALQAGSGPERLL